ncbi:MAG: aminotransferase class I/II-fold pyridoxal phosphate-dependent enzyme [Rhodospirillaceae bacterium]|jgi:succinyldiaminopimelate transaminase|nr:aminotransferase class I/II-fold pyridoxal phosphate-dependent enzyme [Rhodospirillaceae bacterium]MBT5459815.1 aminotransferase class I/II-fold pyridoxal phosphate-dependent enzyme [Rhodospirillaceae bacterium]
MINDRLDRIGDYPFDRLRALLDSHTPRVNLPLISLALGEPQHQPPDMVKETIAASADLWGRYPPVWGTPEFRSTVGDWLTKRYALPADMLDADSSVIPVSGTREALFMIALTAVPEKVRGRQPAVLMPNPFYQVYLGAAALSGAEPVFVPATAETGFLPEFGSLDSEILDRTALAYYCSPANPQGTVASLETLTGLIKLARERGFVVLFDECYSEIYGDTPPPGGMAACAALGGSLDNVLVFNSLSKRSSVPGLRSGFVAGDPELISSFKRVRDYGGSPPPLPLLAAATALWQDEAHVEQNRAQYRQKFDLADKFLTGRYGYYRPAGGFYLWLDVEDGEAAALRLWQEAAMRVIPGIYLAKTDAQGQNPGAGYIRCALVHDLETTEQALQRLSTTL